MNKENLLKTGARAIITISTMAAVNDIFGFFAPTRSGQTLHRLGSNISGICIGYAVGKKISDICIAAVERGIDAYNGRENSDG